MSKRSPALPFLLATLLFVSGCSLFGPTTRITTEPDSYAVAEQYLERENYNLAIEQLTAMENRFPFGNYATQVQFDLMYAEYQQSRYSAALRRANRFIRLQPAHPQVDYVYYMRGLTEFALANQPGSLLGTRNPIDRDVNGYERTFREMRDFVTRYPDSEYARDARVLMQVSRTRLATHSLNVAQYYYQVERYGAALERLDKVLAEFPGEPEQERALALKTRTHERLDEPEPAAATRRLLTELYPDSEYLRNGELVADFEFSRPWYFWATLGLVG